VAVLITTPDGIPLVRDLTKPAPVYWKLPGGRSEGGETPEQCAVREVWEEIGVLLSVKDLKILYSEDKSTHRLTIFRVCLVFSPQLKSEGSDGEQVSYFWPQVIRQMRDFFPNHLKVIWGILGHLR
jgi:8-oxo-dGTP pyrophosphatase MutT (NUDIX family)